jgi:PAS domain S-box-containing protein
MANVVIKDRRGGNPRSAAALQNAILNSAVISSIATDERGVIRILSAGAERMLGYTEAEVAGKRTPADFSDPLQSVARARALSLEFATAVDPGFQALVFKASRGIEDQYELTWIRKDGSRLPAVVSVIALGDPKGEVIGYLMLTTDNTAQETFRLMVESVTDCGIVQLDAQGRVLSWNAGAQIIDGYGAQEIVGQHFSRFYSAQDVELGVPQRDLDAAAATGRHETEGWRSRKDGSMYRANIVLTSIHDQAGVLRGFARLTRDVARSSRMSEPQQSAIESPEPACAPAPEPRPAGGAPRLSLLYVEDHPASLGMVEQLVARRTDMLLLRAANVRLGIELAHTARPEVILLNIDLPGTGALQFMKLLRADPATQNTPLLALGANAAPAAIKNALEAGFFHYLTKPLEPERFTQALDDALEFAALERAEQDDRAYPRAHSHIEDRR